MRRVDRAVAMAAAGLDVRRVDTWSCASGVATLASLLAAVVVNPHEVEGVEVTREDTKNR